MSDKFRRPISRICIALESVPSRANPDVSYEGKMSLKMTTALLVIGMQNYFEPMTTAALPSMCGLTI
jgi:hypothetical protein